MIRDFPIFFIEGKIVDIEKGKEGIFSD